MAKGPWDNDDSAPSSPKEEKNKQQNSGNFVDDIFQEIMNFFDNKGSSRRRPFNKKSNKPKHPKNFKALSFVAALVVAGMWMSSGVFYVSEGEYAVILRFGRLNRILTAGLHMHMPSPIEERIVRRVDMVNKIENITRSDQTKSLDGIDSTLFLTGDENMVHIHYTVLWTIKDVKEYLFTNRFPDNTIRDAAESAVREIVGQTPARLVLTTERESIGMKAQELLQKLLDFYKIGVSVKVQLQRVDPPGPVVRNFNELQGSLLKAQQLANEAEAYRNEVLPVARGESEQILRSAEAYKAQLIAEAEGDSKRFINVWKTWQTQPEVASQWLEVNMLKKILKNAPKIVLDGKTTQGVLPYLNVQELTKEQKNEK